MNGYKVANGAGGGISTQTLKWCTERRVLSAVLKWCTECRVLSAVSCCPGEGSGAREGAGTGENETRRTEEVTLSPSRSQRGVGGGEEGEGKGRKGEGRGGIGRERGREG